MTTYMPTRIALVRTGDTVASMLTLGELRTMGFVTSHTARYGLSIVPMADDSLTVASIERYNDGTTVIAVDPYGTTYERLYIGAASLAADCK